MSLLFMYVFAAFKMLVTVWFKLCLCCYSDSWAAAVSGEK